MKYFLFLLFIPFSAFSQSGKITYSSVLNFAGSEQKKTFNELLFTKQASIYRLKSANKHDGSNNENAEDENIENEKTVKINISSANDTLGNLYFHDLKNKKFICREPIFQDLSLQFFNYKDNGALDMKWELNDEFKKISGYNCQKATTKFRGRNYEGWFTSDIPLPYGPWKFGGLPGLILEIYDLSGEVYFNVEQIEIPYKAAKDIVNEPPTAPLISHREFVKKNEETSNKVSQAMLARLPKGAKITSIKTKKNAVELEYQWDTE